MKIREVMFCRGEPTAPNSLQGEKETFEVKKNEETARISKMLPASTDSEMVNET